MCGDVELESTTQCDNKNNYWQRGVENRSKDLAVGRNGRAAGMGGGVVRGGAGGATYGHSNFKRMNLKF
eukprot:scaffold6596_cov161-Amphora_coffeaeformis.AAC.17